MLPETQQRLLEALHGLPLQIRLGKSLSSITARLDGARPGPTVLLRSDMDALAMQEENAVSFCSEIAGQAHACGHDAHMAMLVGAARVLCDARDRLAGSVLFVFQPGEEARYGARIMLEEGLLDPEFAGEVKLAFALHQFPTLPAGSIAVRPGPILAGMDSFRIRVTGRGGHGSAPHQALDPVPIACEIVSALQAFATRRISVFDPAVITVAKIQAGSAINVISDYATLEGTARSVSERTRAEVVAGIERVAHGVASAHGATASLERATEELVSIPVTVNDPSAAARVQRLAAELLGRERVIDLEHPMMATEDFSFILQKVPGAMAFLGTRPPGQPAEPLHSPRMQLDEDQLSVGTAMHVAVALSVLES